MKNPTDVENLATVSLETTNPSVKDTTNPYEELKAEVHLKEYFWIGLGSLALFMNAVWLTFVLVWNNDSTDHDQEVFLTFLHFRAPFLTIISSISLIVSLYFVVLFFWYIIKCKVGKELTFHVVHKCLTLISIFGISSLLIVYLVLWPEEFSLLSRSNQTCVPILHLVLCFLLIPLAVFFLSWNEVSSTFTQRVLKCFTFLFIYIFILVIPVFVDSAHIIDGNLPPRPLIIAHRGDSQETPENTLSSFALGLNLSVGSLESDIQISFDGLPFMLHDEVFERTTNVRNVFPHRRWMKASFFNISDIKLLDAGCWFDEKWKGETVPLLSEVLDLLLSDRDGDTKLMSDVIHCPSGHPYFGQEEEIVLDMIEQKNVSHRILWLVSNSSKKLMLRKRFPLMALVSPDGTLDEVESGLISCFFQFKLGLH
eukprot:TRINITY_DN2628_c0_g1_i17.p1 TRINITY_DN2628_c0_g1~~TRINITY_DN2628_c0_g1_i17.p1  ORF type:complete len:425 (+),score=51.82 TRINITY_DN2628_c0_g1_i17:67-1341(+)